MGTIYQDLNYRVFVDLSLGTDCAITMSPNVRNGGGSSVAITTLQQAYNNGGRT